jgi:hypothetical protein
MAKTKKRKTKRKKNPKTVRVAGHIRKGVRVKGYSRKKPSK